jgi:hypothetical protein
MTLYVVNVLHDCVNSPEKVVRLVPRKSYKFNFFCANLDNSIQNLSGHGRSVRMYVLHAVLEAIGI